MTTKDGMWLITKPVPELGAIPGDFVCIDPKDENPFVLTRILHRYDVEAISSREDILPVREHHRVSHLTLVGSKPLSD